MQLAQVERNAARSCECPSPCMHDGNAADFAVEFVTFLWLTAFGVSAPMGCTKKPTGLARYVSSFAIINA